MILLGSNNSEIEYAVIETAPHTQSADTAHFSECARWRARAERMTCLCVFPTVPPSDKLE